MLRSLRVFDAMGRYAPVRRALEFVPYHLRPHMDTSITLPSALPAEKSQMEKWNVPHALPLVSSIYNMYVAASGWINVGCQGLSGLKAKAVMHRGTGQAGCVADRILYLQIQSCRGTGSRNSTKLERTGLAEPDFGLLARRVSSVAFSGQEPPTSTGNSHLTKRL